MMRSCFDPKLASEPTRTVPVARVIDLLLVTHASERVAHYRQAMVRGDKFPPISVLPLLGWFLVTDGHKRFTAYKSLDALGRGFSAAPQKRHSTAGLTSEILVQTWTIHRSLLHLGRQTCKEASQGSKIVIRLGRDPEAPGEFRKFVLSRVRHYQRLGRSLWWRISGTST